jgi:PAS domain S-box-containing protein
MTLEQLETLRRVLTANQANGLPGLVDTVAPLLPRLLDCPRAALVVRDRTGAVLAAAGNDSGTPVDPTLAPASWRDARITRHVLALDGRGGGELQLVHTAPAGDDALPEALARVLALVVERQEALAAERYLAALFNSGPVVVFRWRNAPGWPVEDVSPNVTKEFGWTMEQVVGQPYAPLVHPDDLERVGAEVAREVAARRSYFEQQYRLVDRQGTARDVYDFTHVVRDAAGEVTHFHGYVFDDSRRLEAERAREGLERRLAQSQKLEAVGTLASGVAHDFNNVLASVLAHVELARRRVTDARALEDLDLAVSSAQHGRDVVKQMMLFTRAMGSPRTPLVLGPVIARALELARTAIPRTVLLDTNLEPHTPPVLADATQLEQVVLNLVTNATHAMPDGGELSVALATVPSGPGALVERRCVRLTVRDTGHGMPPEVLQRAFEPFFTTRGPGHGTGLGLAMVHGIVTAHDGAVTLQSRPGHGTTATVWLPCTATPEPAHAPPAAPTAEGHGERLAIVDDHASLASATARLVESFGFSARVFTRATDLLRALEREPGAFDLVVTDQSMPDLTGVELATTLRGRGVAVPVLIVTGLVTSVDISGVAAPVEVLAKPYRGEELAQVLVRLLRRAR